MRILHVSDIHFWSYVFRPSRLLSKRIVGMFALWTGRARRFPLEGVGRLVERVAALGADHLLITGDLTTTALPEEFRAARAELAPWLGDPSRVTIVPGNHDRYTRRADRGRRFEHYFGEFAPKAGFPWLRWLDGATAVLGLDPTRAGLTARGALPPAQWNEARRLLSEAVDAGPSSEGARLLRPIIACHYPLAAPPNFRHDLARKSLDNAEEIGRELRAIGPHLFCCGHVHAAWAFRPPEVPNQLCVNPGPPLVPARFGRGRPGFVEIQLDGPDVTIDHHGWTGETWEVERLHHTAGFFPTGPERGRS